LLLHPFHLYHDKNNILSISWQEQHFIYIMTRTTFHLYHDKSNISSISWQEQHFIYIMTRTTFYLYHDKNNIMLFLSWYRWNVVHSLSNTHSEYNQFQLNRWCNSWHVCLEQDKYWVRGAVNILSISWQEQHFIYIMTRTTFHLYHDKSNISSISWQEQHFIYIMTRTTFHLYHDKNNILSDIDKMLFLSWYR
jgi:hypothetical protein